MLFRALERLTHGMLEALDQRLSSPATDTLGLHCLSLKDFYQMFRTHPKQVA
jgi:hypothetical protein|tara:strand:- start:586 stop:741 length:156 start_codon:yes stop_codon:yes gene_type:complete